MSDETFQIGHRCDCTDEPAALPELDATAIPHVVRHGAVLGALGQLGAGKGLVLAAPHDPLPLLRQVDQQYPDRFSRRYLTEGPDVWRIEFVRAPRA